MSRERQVVIRSDLTGEIITDPASAVTITIRFSDRRRGALTLDAREEEVDEFIRKGRPALSRSPRSRGNSSTAE